MLLKSIALIVLFAFLLIVIGALLKVLITIKTDNIELNKDNFEDYLEDLSIVKSFQAFEKNNIETLLRVSGNPYKFSKLTWCLVKFGVPIAAVIVSFVIYAFTNDVTYAAIPILFGVMAFVYPTYYYKQLILDRERMWNKIHSHIWRISNSLDDNGPKKVCIEMRDYFESVNETELALGFETFYELWPDDPDNIPEALENLNRNFPFDIPKDLYGILLECWRNTATATERLESFKATCELKYEKYSNELLSKVPSTATMYSLPFLLISVMAAILFPALLDILEALQ